MKDLLQALEGRYRNLDLQSYPSDIYRTFKFLRDKIDGLQKEYQSSGEFCFAGDLIWKTEDYRDVRFLFEKDLLEIIEERFGISTYLDYQGFGNKVEFCIRPYNDWDDCSEEDLSDEEIQNFNFDNMMYWCFETPLLELDAFLPELENWMKEQNNILTSQGHM